MSFSPIMQNIPKVDLTTAPDPVLFDADLVASYDRMMDACCDVDCDMNCTDFVSCDNRQQAYDRFRAATDARIEQNLLLCASIELEQRLLDTDIIEQTAEFWLGNEIKTKVCKTFFARTLGLPDARLDALLDPVTFQWFSKHISPTGSFIAASTESHHDSEPGYIPERPCTDFVLNSRKHLEKNHSAFVEETDSDTDVHIDDVPPSIYNEVISHIQTIPRVIRTLVNPENNQETIKFEISIKYDHMYLNYLKISKKNKKKISKKQYKKIYNTYMQNEFMV